MFTGERAASGVVADFSNPRSIAQLELLRISREGDSMIVVLNGPLGIGKSSLAETLMERIDGCVMLDGDALIAVNPPHDDQLEHLHSTIALLISHHRRFGYRFFVLSHLWRSPEELADLRRRLEPDARQG